MLHNVKLTRMEGLLPRLPCPPRPAVPILPSNGRLINLNHLARTVPARTRVAPCTANVFTCSVVFIKLKLCCLHNVNVRIATQMMRLHQHMSLRTLLLVSFSTAVQPAIFTPIGTIFARSPRVLLKRYVGSPVPP